MRTLKLYATGSATGNGVASITIPSKSTIRGVQWSVRITSITAASQVDLEISRSSSREIAVLGAQQCVAEVAMASNFVTSGLAQTGTNTFMPVAVNMDQGQLLYLHAVVGGTLTYTATAIIHFD